LPKSESSTKHDPPRAWIFDQSQHTIDQLHHFGL
jgi:hypothetical protein